MVDEMESASNRLLRRWIEYRIGAMARADAIAEKYLSRHSEGVANDTIKIRMPKDFDG